MPTRIPIWCSNCDGTKRKRSSSENNNKNNEIDRCPHTCNESINAWRPSPWPLSRKWGGRGEGPGMALGTFPLRVTQQLHVPLHHLLQYTPIISSIMKPPEPTKNKRQKLLSTAVSYLSMLGQQEEQEKQEGRRKEAPPWPFIIKLIITIYFIT
jgi:hypothetical protein